VPLIYDKQSARELADTIRWYEKVFKAAWRWASRPFRKKDGPKDDRGGAGGHSGR
jgi:hypothetical protein